MNKTKPLSEVIWIHLQRFYELDLHTRLLCTLAEKTSIDCFTKNQFLKMEEPYLSALNYSNSKFHPFVSKKSTGDQSMQENAFREYSNIPRLPKITLPIFLGS